MRLLLTGGQKGDAPQAIPLLEGFDFTGVLADRGYDADAILDFIIHNEAEAIIPAKRNRLVQRDIDWHTYKARHLVECFMNKIKHMKQWLLKQSLQANAPLILMLLITAVFLPPALAPSFPLEGVHTSSDVQRHFDEWPPDHKQRLADDLVVVFTEAS